MLPPSIPRSCGDNHTPAVGRQRELRFPHPRVQRKGVYQQQRAPRASGTARGRFEVAQTSNDWHAVIVTYRCGVGRAS